MNKPVENKVLAHSTSTAATTAGSARLRVRERVVMVIGVSGVVPLSDH
jgi:hypothetical protein